MKHGEQRNRRVEASWRLADGRTPDGQSVDLGHGTTQTVSERWCASCELWLEVRGVMGGIAFEFEHAEGHVR
jgi:hypothetical protein